MDDDRLDRLARALVGSPSRRGIVGGLLGSVVGAAPALPHDLSVADAKKKHKKKRRRKRRKNKDKDKNQPFCAGKNFCGDSGESACDDGIGVDCFCYPTVESGAPFCADSQLRLEDCSECLPTEVCVDLEGCLTPPPFTACATPCPNPR